MHWIVYINTFETISFPFPPNYFSNDSNITENNDTTVNSQQSNMNFTGWCKVIKTFCFKRCSYFSGQYCKWHLTLWSADTSDSFQVLFSCSSTLQKIKTFSCYYFFSNIFVKTMKLRCLEQFKQPELHLNPSDFVLFGSKNEHRDTSNKSVCEDVYLHIFCQAVFEFVTSCVSPLEPW